MSFALCKVVLPIRGWKWQSLVVGRKHWAGEVVTEQSMWSKHVSISKLVEGVRVLDVARAIGYSEACFQGQSGAIERYMSFICVSGGASWRSQETLQLLS